MNNFAISSTGIGEALQRSASALAAAGNTMEESIGMITAMNSVLQNPDAVGTTMKTVTMYLRAAKTEAEQAGEEVEGMANSVSELRNQIMHLTSESGTSVDIMADASTFKSTYAIMQELAQVWDKLTDVTQANILELIGGKRNANAVTALLTNFKDAAEASTAAMESAGSAMVENARYMDSIAGRAAQLKTSFEALSSSVLDARVPKFLLSVATHIVDIASALNRVHMLLPALTAIAGLGIAGRNTIVARDSFFKIASLAKNAKDMDDFKSSVLGVIDTLDRAQIATLKQQLKVGELQEEYKEAAQAVVAFTAAQKGEQKLGFFAGAGKAMQGLLKSWTFWLTVLEAVYGGIMWHIDRQTRIVQEKIDAANEMIEAQANGIEKHEANLRTLRSMYDRFNELSKGINSAGEPIGLTNEEHEEYLSLLDQIVEISPEVVKGYDAQGNQIIEYNTVMSEAISLQKEMLENMRKISDGEAATIIDGKAAEYKKYHDELVNSYRNILLSEVKRTGFGNIAASSRQLQAFFDATEQLGIFDSENYTVDVYKHSEDILHILRQATAENGALIFTEEQINNIAKAFQQAAPTMQNLTDNIETQTNTMMQWVAYADKTAEWYNNLPQDAIDEFNAAVAELVDPSADFTEKSSQINALGASFTSALDTDAVQSALDAATDLKLGKIGIRAYRAAVDAAMDELAGITADYVRLADASGLELSKTVFGNIDTNNRQILEWNQENVDKYRDALEAWGYAPEQALGTFSALLSSYGTYDGVEIAFTPILQTPEGAELLDKTTLDSYLNALIDKASADGSLTAGALISLDAEGLEVEGKHISGLIADIGETAEDTSLQLNYIAGEGMSNAVKAQRDAASLAQSVVKAYLDSYTNVAAYNSVITSSVIRDTHDAKQSLERLADGYDVLSKAQDEMRDSGSLSSETIQAVAESLTGDERISDYLYAEGEAIKLNTQAWQERSEAMTQENIDDLGVSIKATEENTKQRKARIAALEAQIDEERVLSEHSPLIAENTRLINIEREAIRRNGQETEDATLRMHAYIQALQEQRDAMENDPLNFDGMVDEVENVTGEVADLMTALDTVADGTALSMSDMINLAMKYPQLLSTLNLFDVTTLEGQQKMLASVRDEYEKLFDTAIDAQIELLKTEIEANPEGESEAAIQAAIANLKTLKEVGIGAFMEAEAEKVVSANERILDSYEKMSTAGDFIADFSTNAEISYEAYRELIDVSFEYARAVEYKHGALTLNKQKYDEVTKSLMQNTLATAKARAEEILLGDEYKKLVEKIDDLSDEERSRLNELNAEITGYVVLANEIDNATESYQRFLNADEDVNSDRFTAGAKAFKVITDTLKDAESDIYGMVGREQYKEALSVLVRPEIDVDSPEFDKSLERLERYLADSSQGVNNFFSDLVAHGFADATTGVITGTVDAMAEKLGVTAEVVRTMLDEMVQYGAKDLATYADSIDFSDGEDSATSLKDEVASLQSMLDSVQTDISDIGSSEMVLQTTNAEDALGRVSKGLTDIIEKLNKISSIGKINIKINQSSSLSGSVTNVLGGLAGAVADRIFKGRASAGGTTSAAGGRTLVGEIGMETVVDPESGRYYTVGAKGPEFVNLPKNAIVLNSYETAKLFGVRRPEESGRAMALGNGTLASKLPTKLDKATELVVANIAKKTIQAAAKSVQSDTKTAVSRVVSKAISNSVNMQFTPTKGNGSGGSSGSGGGSSKEELTLLEKILEKYQKINEELEHQIEHQEFLYKQSQRGYEFDGMEASLQKQVEIYRKMMEEAQEAVGLMIQAGATDTDEELQEMERAYWSAYDSLYETLDEINALYVDALNEKIDNIQTAYDNLSQAATEFNEGGGITVDTFQQLLSHGVQYLSLLEKVNGQYEINADGIARIIDAEKEQLAVESALSYLNSIQTALGDGDVNAVNALVDATHKVSDATWDAVYAQAAMLKNLGLTGDQYNTIIQNIEVMRGLSNNVVTDLTAGTEEVTDNLGDQEQAIDRILELTQDLIKHEVEERIEAIEDEIDAYKKIVDLKRKALETTKEQNKYEREVSDKAKSIAEMQARIDQLALDDSREAQAERAGLIAEMEEMQTDLSDYQSDHAYDQQMDMLDRMEEEYEEKRQKDIEALEQSISSTEKLYQAAIERINSQWDTLYKQLIDWNTEFGSSLNADITTNWNLATEAVKEYGSYLQALEQLRGLSYQEGVGSLPFDNLPEYHSGGVVGDEGSINKEEALAILKKGEIVLDEQASSGLMRMIDFQKMLADKLGVAIGNIELFRQSMIPAVATAGMNRNVVSDGGLVFNAPINVLINHNGDLKDTDAASFGDKIAHTALDKLYEAFNRKGITSIRNRNLKQ